MMSASAALALWARWARWTCWTHRARGLALLAALGFGPPCLASDQAASPTHAPDLLPFDQALHWPLPAQSASQAQGTVSCASSTCHGAIAAWPDTAVLQNEYVTWSRLDKHAHSLEVLNNRLSRSIAQKLGIGDPSQAKICLDCHTDHRPAQDAGSRFSAADGIGCEACHGASEHWLKSHVAADATHAENLAHGMFPVEDAVARARLCLSCHLGNTDQLVSHRLLGAGHPRLSFELETFSMLEPAHFRLRSVAPPHALRWNAVRLWAVGQAMAVSQSLQIMLDAKRGHDGVFPELALYDCNACHHDRSRMSWTPHTTFGAALAPGVVRLNQANLVMMEVVARHLDPALGARVREAAHQLDVALAEAGDVPTAAQNLDRFAKQVAARADQMALERADLAALSLALIDDGLAGRYIDYSCAEQGFMAISSLMDFANRNGWLAHAAEINEQLGALDAQLANDEQYDPRAFRDRLKSLRAHFVAPTPE